ncbi:WLM-domain-containing protein [Tilletiaria anomala UBC 951]|uniref:WLM-domain-containing protein n=1 Tax=Tilletiaria anomala (strain ATCC 24038 / CBS 436.72 / UBC 951) TaxID=1037660 RepID=A0A066VL88_TILAU|nr:WLM-domain-containing protein [Tilletiaria anomala UBC 951]KDN39320.1 WLM-domain-containing protein [Tilletiaria anomala UBC 951]
MVVDGKGKFKGIQPLVTSHYESAHASGSGTAASAPRIREYRALKKMPRAEEALQILRRIGAVVKPLMASHGWVLPLLAEFSPKQDNLLGINVNRGQKICLRLRWNHSPDAFLDEEDVIHTMLHELTHTARGPHDAMFFKLLGNLTEEYWDLKRKGFVSFEAFTGQAFRLGGSIPSREPAMALARRRAAEQAEQRRRIAEHERGGGGASSGSACKTPAQLAAEAAERRSRHIPAACPESAADNARAVQEAEDEEAIQGIRVIRIEDDEEEPDVWILNDNELPPRFAAPSPPHARSRANKEASEGARAQDEHEVIFLDDSCSSSEDGDDDDSVVIIGTRGVPSQNKMRVDGKRSSSGTTTWLCSACALRNAAKALRCTTCDAARRALSAPTQDPAASPGWKAAAATPDGWQCAACDFPMTGDLGGFWMCRGCGAIRPG